MRYHYHIPNIYLSKYGETYVCDHPVYNKCTLFTGINKNIGLAIIQQKHNKSTKQHWWGEIDSYLTDAIYLHNNFRTYFNERSGRCASGIYPTVTVRQVMWALKMKPLPRERWETYFDRRFI